MANNQDALVVLEEVANSLRESAEDLRVTSSYDKGLAMGYYQALSTLLSNCEAVGIAPGDIGMAGFDVESLLRPKRKAE